MFNLPLTSLSSDLDSKPSLKRFRFNIPAPIILSDPFSDRSTSRDRPMQSNSMPSLHPDRISDFRLPEDLKTFKGLASFERLAIPNTNKASSYYMKSIDTLELFHILNSQNTTREQPSQPKVFFKRATPSFHQTSSSAERRKGSENFEGTDENNMLVKPLVPKPVKRIDFQGGRSQMRNSTMRLLEPGHKAKQSSETMRSFVIRQTNIINHSTQENESLNANNLSLPTQGNQSDFAPLKLPDILKKELGVGKEEKEADGISRNKSKASLKPRIVQNDIFGSFLISSKINPRPSSRRNDMSNMLQRKEMDVVRANKLISDVSVNLKKSSFQAYRA